MPSKQVTDRQKSASAVIAAARTHGPRAAEAVASTLAGTLAGADAQPNVALMLELCARRLEASIAAVVQADEAHEAELADDAAPREQRDEHATALYADVIELKEIATGLLGRAVLEPLRLTGSTPRDAVVLTRHAEGVVEALRTVTLPDSRVQGATFQAEAWAERLTERATALSSAVQDVAREAREAEATLVDKQRALAEHDRTFGDVATVVSAMLRMGGELELANRVRPSTRRPGRLIELADDGGDEPIAVG